MYCIPQLFVGTVDTIVVTLYLFIFLNQVDQQVLMQGLVQNLFASFHQLNKRVGISGFRALLTRITPITTCICADSSMKNPMKVAPGCSCPDDSPW